MSRYEKKIFSYDIEACLVNWIYLGYMFGCDNYCLDIKTHFNHKLRMNIYGVKEVCVNTTRCIEFTIHRQFLFAFKGVTMAFKDLLFKNN